MRVFRHRSCVLPRSCSGAGRGRGRPGIALQEQRPEAECQQAGGVRNLPRPARGESLGAGWQVPDRPVHPAQPERRVGPSRRGEVLHRSDESAAQADRTEAQKQDRLGDGRG